MNKVFITGNLAADPILKNTNSGINIVNLTIATSDQRSKSETYFFPCVAFGNQANFANTYLKKGDSVAIDGRLTRRSYVSKEGKTVYITEIIIDNIQSIGRKTNTPQTQKMNLDMVSIDESFPNKILTQNTNNTKKENNEVNLDWINNEIDEE